MVGCDNEEFVSASKDAVSTIVFIQFMCDSETLLISMYRVF